MPIPLLVAIPAAIASALGGGAGVGIYKNNKHNKEKKDWQDEKLRLQEKIEECQKTILARQEKICDLQRKVKERDQKIAKLTHELHECDRMIDILEQRQVQLESRLRTLLAFLTFRYSEFRAQSASRASQLTEKRDHREQIKALIEGTSVEMSELSGSIQECELSLKYFEDEKADKEQMLAEVSEGR